MPPEVCPLLGTLDDTNNPCPPVEYPSFENHCLVSDDRDTLLLADQASYCLSGGHVVCPRFQIASAARRGARVDARMAADLTDGALASDSLRPELMAAALDGDERATSRRWAWLGTGLVFISVMLCGSIFALWSGWQQVQGYLVQREEGIVASIAATGSDQPAFVVITATPNPLVVAVAPQTNTAQDAAALQPAPPAAGFQPGSDLSSQAAESSAPNAAPSSLQQFPQAVTATPGGATLGAAAAIAPLPGTGGNPSGELLQVPVEEPPNVLLEVPTRRPTPIFDIPTSTPATEVPTALPTATLSPTPAGTPSIVFGPAQQLVPLGGCTIVSWQVQNVREVYYENIGVDGRGQAEECVDDVLEIYHLVVVLPDGSSRTYTTTVTLLQPTHTPQPTATFTPYVEPTPTWTLVPATATPTPVVRYGAVVNIAGSTQQDCPSGSTCTIPLVVLNTGERIDTLLASIQEGGAWSSQLCRMDSVCARTNLALAEMGPGNAANILFSVTLPADATGTQRYMIDALSNASGGNVRSDPVYLDITAK